MMKREASSFRRVTEFALFLVFSFARFSSLHADDRAVLNEIARSWNSSLASKWVGNNHCVWTGVVCGQPNVVTSLLLPDEDLVGPIPDPLWQLTSLEYLTLSGNPTIGGSISRHVQNLARLKELDLQNCGLTGVIPDSITRLSALQNMFLNGNSLTGRIPADLSGLRSLIYFDISFNKVEGPLPDSIGDLESLVHIHVQNNTLSGGVPSTVASLKKLKHLILEYNNFSGPLPEVTSDAIAVITANGNKFSGQKIPRSFFAHTSLSQLNLAGCNFTDDLTSVDWKLLPGLANLDLSDNPNLKGAFPDASGLQYLRLDNSPNIFTEKKWIAVSDSLKGSLSKIRELHLVNCGLTGEINDTPAGFLKYLDLRNNRLSGSFPRSLTGTGTVGITVMLGGNPELCEPSAVKNSLFPSILEKACSPQGYFVLEVTDRRTTCSVNCVKGQPNPIYKIVNPSSGDCPCASPLVIQIRLLEPAVSASVFQQDSQLRNNLTGQFTAYFNLNPAQVYVANSTAEDRSIIIWTFWWPADNSPSFDEAEVLNITNTLRNRKPSLAPPFGIFYVMDVLDPKEAYARKSRPSLSTGAAVGIAMAALVSIAVILALVFYSLCQRRRAREAEASKNIILATSYGGAAHTGTSTGPRLKGARLFTMAELRKATGNFASANVVGDGGYGKVYKGKLEDGREVAVKRLAKESHQGPQEFNAEIELLSRVHHRNLVELVGFCNMEEEQVLVYELMQNGTVKDWLTGVRKPPLSFDKRLEIALGAAQGLSYLHHDCSPAIIHRDIKSANILLSANMTAKVADFGLSKNVEKKEEDASVVKGTLGYLDPDYYNTQILSEKTDVYSFGVVLLELMTGRPPVNKTTRAHISREVKTALAQGTLLTLKDPAFTTDFKEDTYRSLINIGLRCLQDGEERAFRPSMSVVVKELDSICTLAGVIQTAPSSPISVRRASGASSMDFDNLMASGYGTTSSFFKTISRSISGTKHGYKRSPKYKETSDVENPGEQAPPQPGYEDSSIGMTKTMASWWKPGQ